MIENPKLLRNNRRWFYNINYFIRFYYLRFITTCKNQIINIKSII